jgi:hypothetical protein
MLRAAGVLWGIWALIVVLMLAGVVDFGGGI